VPAVWTVRALFRQSLAGGAEEDVLRGTRAGLEAVRELLEIRKAEFSRRLQSGAAADTLDPAQLDPSERRLLQSSLAAAAPGEPVRVRLGGGDRLVARTPAAGGSRGGIVTEPLDPELVARAARLTDALRLAETLRRDRDSLARGLLMTFLSVYGVILLLVVILGLLVASRLTRPLGALGAGIDRLAAGDLTARADPAASGHLGRLFDRFNRMAERLGTQQEELVRLERLAAWRNLARRLAHEIKNPLTPIQLASQQVRDSYTGDDPAYRRTLEEAVEIVEEEVRALRSLVREFSDFARLPEPVMADCSVKDLVEDTIALYGEERVRFETPVDPAALRVRCDAGEIHRVLINLVNNALQAQEETGAEEPVVLGVARAPGGGVVFSVADRGPGVPRAERRRIFTPDYSTKTEGMGLGLAIVEGILRVHGGAVEVADRPAGGAMFRFTLTEVGTEAGGSPRPRRAPLDASLSRNHES